MNKRLTANVISGRIPHTIVISGGSYNERIDEAYELCEAVLCETPKDGLPCGTCSACIKLKAKSHADISEVFPEEDHKELSVKIVRKVREDAFIVPNEGKRKIYIFPVAETLNESSQNALLKVLEEPPTHAMFILLCPSKSVLLTTILSRAASFSLDEVADDHIIKDKKSQAKILDNALKIAQAVLSNNPVDLFSATADFEKDKQYELLGDTLKILDLIFRDAQVLRQGATSLIAPVESNPTSKELSQKYSTDQIFKMIDAVGSVSKAVDIHSNKKLTITRLCSLLLGAANDR